MKKVKAKRKGPKLQASVDKPTKRRVVEAAAARSVSESRLLKFWITDRLRQEAEARRQEDGARGRLASMAAYGYRPTADQDALRELLCLG